MNYDAPASERIITLHEQAEHLADMAKHVSSDAYAATLRARADNKVRQAAHLREEAGL